MVLDAYRDQSWNQSGSICIFVHPQIWLNPDPFQFLSGKFYSFKSYIVCHFFEHPDISRSLSGFIRIYPDNCLLDWDPVLSGSLSSFVLQCMTSSGKWSKTAIMSYLLLVVIVWLQSWGRHLTFIKQICTNIIQPLYIIYIYRRNWVLWLYGGQYPIVQLEAHGSAASQSFTHRPPKYTQCQP